MTSPFSSSAALRARRRARRRQWLISILVLLVALVLAGWWLWTFTPWPNALLIRSAFARSGRAQAEALEPFVPPGIEAIPNIRYLERDRRALLDVFYPEAQVRNGATLPAVVWVHGGAWVGGDKSEVANYLKVIAAEGYTTVGVNYGLAPRTRYPEPVAQVNAALAYLVQNAARLNIDPTRIVLAGSSAGAHIAAQTAALTVDPTYAERLGIEPALPLEHLAGVVLAAGAYDPTLANLEGPFADLLQTALWAYAGTRDFQASAAFESANVTASVSGAFPPTFITAGNGDPLLGHSEALAARLAERGVRVETLFWPADHTPALPHEYQYNLDTPEGQEALTRILAFLADLTK